MAEKKQKVYKWPKTPGACADRGYKLRLERQALMKKVKELEDEEKALKKHMYKLLGSQRLTGVKGKISQFTMASKDVPTIEDFDKILKFAAKTLRGQMPYAGLIQRRLNNKMVSDLEADGKTVPGVGSIEVITGNFNKL